VFGLKELAADASVGSFGPLESEDRDNTLQEPHSRGQSACECLSRIETSGHPARGVDHAKQHRISHRNSLHVGVRFLAR
jgi:hypothetical protein